MQLVDAVNNSYICCALWLIDKIITINQEVKDYLLPYKIMPVGLLIIRFIMFFYSKFTVVISIKKTINGN